MNCMKTTNAIRMLDFLHMQCFALHIVLAGSNSTHSVCVCTYHQNPKLQIFAIPVKGITYKILM